MYFKVTGIYEGEEYTAIGMNEKIIMPERLNRILQYHNYVNYGCLGLMPCETPPGEYLNDPVATYQLLHKVFELIKEDIYEPDDEETDEEIVY